MMVVPVTLIPGLPTGTPPAERAAFGKQARKLFPRKELGAWRPAADRPRATDLLLEQSRTRIPALTPIRHARMAVSPFTFFRGSAVVMASDLGRGPHSGLYSQLCGDAHLANLGVFGSAERNVVFDLNDFDETSPGPFEWDVLRLATSFVLAARDNHLGEEEATTAAMNVAVAYQQTIAAAAKRPILQNFYTMFTPDQIMAWVRESGTKVRGRAQERLGKQVEKIKARDTWSAVRKLTEIGPDGSRRFLDQPPLLVRLDGIIHGLDYLEVYRRYLATLDIDRQALLSRYEVIDVAHKVVGVGSVGLPALIGLLQGHDENDLMVLQFKAAQESVLEKWTSLSPFAEPGQRVVVGQRLMQATGDPFLGWTTGPNGVAVYGRQLRDFKWSVDLARLDTQRMSGYASMCGATLAMAHARSGDPIAISAYIGKGVTFARAAEGFAHSYADIVETDYAEFTAAIADGEVATDSSRM